MRYSKNQKAAKDFIRFYIDRARFEPYFETMDTFRIPHQGVRRPRAVEEGSEDRRVPGTLAAARQVGRASPPGRRATEVLSKYIIVDMFAKAIQGMKPEDAVSWATAS